MIRRYMSDQDGVRGRAFPRRQVLAAFLLTTGLLWAAGCGGGNSSSGNSFDGSGAPIGTVRDNTQRIIFYAPDTANGSIFTVAPDGTDFVRVTDGLNDDVQPGWAPDRNRLAFVRRRDFNGNLAVRDLYILNANGASIQKVHTAELTDATPTWSPDSTKIAFVRVTSENQTKISVINVDGSGLQDVTTGVTPAWSPNGAQFAFAVSSVSSTSGLQITLINADGTGQRTLLTVPAIPTSTTGALGNDSTPAWSPDGTKIVFSRDLTGGTTNVNGSGIFVVNADGTGLTRITEGRDSSPAWSPDGTQLIFLRIGPSGVSHECYRCNADGSSVTKITDESRRMNRPVWR